MVITVWEAGGKKETPLFLCVLVFKCFFWFFFLNGEWK